jgi:type II restriction enzyme
MWLIFTLVWRINKNEKHELGAFGESLVAKKCHCPRCKRVNSLKNLPNNFKCADVICDFCGFVA